MHRYPWPVLALIALAYAVALHRLEAQSIWFDEGWSAFAATRASLLATASADPTNPPLYYILLGLSTRAAGDGPFALRWFSAVWGIIAIPLAYQLARRLADRRAGLWTAFLVAVSPLLAWASREARMYTLLAVLVLVAALAWHRLRAAGAARGGRAATPSAAPATGFRAAPAAWLALLGAELGLLYAHNTGPVAALWLNAVTVVAWVADRRAAVAELRPAPSAWLIGQIVVVALWLPYLVTRYAALLGANQAVSATSVPDPAFLGRVWQVPWTGPWWMVGQEPVVTASAFVILGLALVARPWRHPGARWLLLHVALLLGGMLGGLWILRNELHGRYLVLLTPLLLAAIGIGMAGIRQPTLRWLACGVFTLNAVVAVHLATTRPGYGHEDVRGMVEHYAERLDGDATVLAWSYADRYDLAYYWDRLGVPARRVTLPEGADVDAILPLLPRHGAVAINVWFAQRADYRGMLECVLGNGRSDEPEVYTTAGMTSLEYRDIALDPPDRVPVAGRIGEARLVEAGSIPAAEADRALCLPVTIELAGPSASELQAAMIVTDAAGRELAHADAIFAQADQRTSNQVDPGARLTAWPLLRLPGATPPGRYPVAMRVYDQANLSGHDVLDASGRALGKDFPLGTWIVPAPADQGAQRP